MDTGRSASPTGAMLVIAGALACVPGGAARAAETTVLVENCLVAPNKDIEVSARIEGEIREVLVTEGDSVKKGQLLAQLVDDHAQVETQIRLMESTDTIKIRSAELQLSVLEYKLKSDEELLKKRAVSELDVLQSRARVEIAKLQIEQSKMERERAKLLHRMSERKLADHQVRAPIAGVVAETTRDTGEGVKPRDAIFRIIDVHVVRVEGYLPVTYLRRVRVGQPVVARLRLIGEQGRTYPGKVVYTDEEVEAASNTFRVKAEVANAAGRLQPGMRATMEITLATRPAKKK